MYARGGLPHRWTLRPPRYIAQPVSRSTERSHRGAVWRPGFCSSGDTHLANPGTQSLVQRKGLDPSQGRRGFRSCHPITESAAESRPPRHRSRSAKATIRRFGWACGAAARRRRAASCSRPGAGRLRAISAAAIDRLMPAKQCSKSGDASCHPSRNSKRAETWWASGRMCPGNGSLMSWIMTRRCRPGLTPGGVGGWCSGSTSETKCAGPSAAAWSLTSSRLHT